MSFSGVMFMSVLGEPIGKGGRSEEEEDVISCSRRCRANVEKPRD